MTISFFRKIFLTLIVGVISANCSFAQGINSDFTVTTSVPFLRITPDARAAGMGNAGIASSADANSFFHNPAKLAFVKKPMGFALNYSPWLRALVSDIFLAYLSGYYKIDDLQAIGASMRYFNLGSIQFTDDQGASLGQGNPYEIAFDLNYARTLVQIKKGGGFAVGIALRFIYSDLASGQVAIGTGSTIKAGVAGAADISFAYNQDFKIKKKFNTNLGIGLNISNIGSKISYTSSAIKDFIPMNFGLGFRYQFNFDEYNQLNLAIDMNKLLVPTPDTAKASGDPSILDYREVSVPASIFTSWADAPGGFSEELREITLSFGMEYWYNQQFAVRAGYFYENANKGARAFFTAGIGLRYNVFGLDFSYLIPSSSIRNPLDNTLRFTLMFEFDDVGRKSQEAIPEGTTSGL